MNCQNQDLVETNVELSNWRAKLSSKMSLLLVPLVHLHRGRHKVKKFAKTAAEKFENCLLVLVNERLVHEVKFFVLNEFSEAYKQSPGVRSRCLQSLEDNLADFLLHFFDSAFRVDEQNVAGECEGVFAWEPKLVDNCV